MTPIPVKDGVIIAFVWQPGAIRKPLTSGGGMGGQLLAVVQRGDGSITTMPASQVVAVSP